MMNTKKLNGCELQLSVEVGENVWLQSLESKYYAFQLPSSTYSGLVGRVVISTWEETKQDLWGHSFIVQDYVGAHRVDVEVGEALASTNCKGTSVGGGRIRSEVNVTESKQVQLGQMGSMNIHDRLLLMPATNNTQGPSSPLEIIRGVSASVKEVDMLSELFPHISGTYQSNSHSQSTSTTVIIRQKGGWELEVVYPWQLILHANNLQKWHIACLLALFAMMWLVIHVLQKSILFLGAELQSRRFISVRDFSRLDGQNTASWQLCLSNSDPARNLSEHISQFKGEDYMRYVGEGRFHEAWRDAEHYLNDAIDGNCEGAYFSYNCTIPSRDIHDSASGRWNRDHAGRLVRQFWPFNY